MRPESLEFLRDLVNAPSPSGYEGPAASVFRDYAGAFAQELMTDVHGNVMAALNPQAPRRIMLAGHIDEIGFIVHHISEEGLLRFKPVGHHDTAICAGQRVWVHGRRRVSGVIGRKAVHLLEDPEEEKKLPPLHEMWIDVGVSSRKEAEALVSLGDVATYQADLSLIESERAIAGGFDNKVGAFVVAEALRALAQDGGLRDGVGVTAVGTVQEEVGFRGATTASYTVNAHVGIAVDVSHATDYPGIDHERFGRLDVGAGPAITRGPYINHTVYDMLVRAARDARIPHQIEVAGECTGTDATPMQVSRGGMATGLIGLPLRYMHTPCELLSLADVEAAVGLLAAFCRSVSSDTDFTPL